MCVCVCVKDRKFVWVCECVCVRKIADLPAERRHLRKRLKREVGVRDVLVQPIDGG